MNDDNERSIRWLSAMRRISLETPEDIDDLLVGIGRESQCTGTDLSLAFDVSGLPPLALRSSDTVSVGVLIENRLSDPAAAASRLCALALEHNVEVIAITTLDYSGLERFGIRTERIVGDLDRNAMLEQVLAFWSIQSLARIEQPVDLS